MPVAGLPAALETLLSFLLAAQEPTSWKIDGEGDNVVVVLRFKQRDGQPLFTTTSDRRGYWRRKTPAQRRRDELRARQHRQKGEGEHFDACLKPNVTVANVAEYSVSAHDPARSSRSNDPADYVTKSLMTFDPPCSDDHHEVADVAPTVSDDDPSATEKLPHRHQNVEDSSPQEATLEDLQQVMKEILQTSSRVFDEEMKKLSEMTATRDEPDSETDHDQVSPMPSAPVQCPAVPEKPAKKTCTSPPERSNSDPSSARRTRSAVRQCVRNAAVVLTPESRTPSTRPHLARSARKT